MIRGIFSWKLDRPLLSMVLICCFSGFFVLYSAGGENMDLIVKQSVRVGIGFVVMLLFAQVAPENLARWTPYLYVLGLIMLVAVLVFGTIGKGAQRWLDLGFFRFQPSELMKLAVPMMVAWVLTKQPLPPSKPAVVAAFAVLLLPVAFIILQPDLGTSILIGASGFVVIFLAGLSWRFLIGMSIACAVALPVLFWTLLHDYQRQRVLTLFDPWSDPLGSGYHTIQSMIAIGSGGLQGKGWLGGSQSQLEFIPERKTDFIFSVLSEEFGLIGFGVLMLIYLLIVFRGLYIAFYTQNTYSRLLAGSLSLTFFFYVFVNIGMVSGILPVVGVPLPLVSYGGTSMVTLMAGFGILMSIRTHRSLMSG